jgi:zinc protease
MPDPFKIAAALSLVILGSRAAFSAASASRSGRIVPFAVHQNVLENGLTIVVVPFDSPGLVAYWTIVRAGSRNEIEPGKTGFAHFFEHMMFRGTARYSTDQYNAVLKGLGAENNAFTTADYTAYHTLAPASALETIMTIESDRFMNLKYSVEDFKKEAGAVLGEYNKNASSPFLALDEAIRDAAFTKHPYKHTTLGFLSDIQAMPEQYEYSLQFFDRYYRPENCILLIVGDVEPKGVMAMAAGRYRSWRRGAYRFQVEAEPPQTGEKRVEVPWPNPTQPYLYIGYHSPALSTSRHDLPALDLLAQLLFSESAPLYQRLVVEDQEVDLLSGGAQDHRDPYLFTILARVKRTDRLAAVEKTIVAAIDALKEKPVDIDRLRRVQSHMRYSFAMGLDTAGGVARSLAGYLALTGDSDAVNQVYALYDRVTPQDVRTVARSYFAPSGRTVVTLGQKQAATSRASR